jgi:hypothetical protein
MQAHVMADEATREEAMKLAQRDQETFANGTGRYKELFIEDTNLSPLYPILVERAKAAQEKAGGA